MLINNENELYKFKEGDSISYYCKKCGILYTINLLEKEILIIIKNFFVINV